MTEPDSTSAGALAKIMLEENPEFRAWVATLDPKHWARYDLAAVRLGWEAARATLQPVADVTRAYVPEVGFNGRVVQWRQNSKDFPIGARLYLQANPNS